MLKSCGKICKKSIKSLCKTSIKKELTWDYFWDNFVKEKTNQTKFIIKIKKLEQKYKYINNLVNI